MNHDDFDGESENREDREDRGPDLPRARPAAPDGLSEADLLALSAFVDGELPRDADAALRERLAGDALAASRVSAYAAQKSALQALCRPADANPAPPYLVLRPRDPWWRRYGVAAAWVMAGAGLALAAGAFLPRGMSADAGGWFVADDAFARRAEVAYAVYTPEQRHPVEVGANDEAHLVAWLSKRLGKPLSVPSLRDYGYALVGGRLLPGTVGPAAQFMYENDAGERLTLYVGTSGKPSNAVRLLHDGSRRTFYWTTDGMDYALSGPPTEGELRKIAYVVCGALGGKPEQW